MERIIAEFDGKVFIPKGPVSLPAGTKVALLLPAAAPKLTEDEKNLWNEIVKELDATEPLFPTVEDAIGYSRGRP